MRNPGIATNTQLPYLNEQSKVEQIKLRVIYRLHEVLEETPGYDIRGITPDMEKSIMDFVEENCDDIEVYAHDTNVEIDLDVRAGYLNININNEGQ